MEKILLWYEISGDHWSEIVYNYHFKGRTPVLLRERTHAVCFLTIITRVKDAPQFLTFHLFPSTCGSAGGWAGRQSVWKNTCGPHPTPTPPKHFSFCTLVPHKCTRQTLIIQKQDDVLKLEADPMTTDKANNIFLFWKTFSYQKTELDRIAHVTGNNTYRWDYSKMFHSIIKSLITLQIMTDCTAFI